MDSQPAIFRLVLSFWFFLGVMLDILLKARVSIVSASNSAKTFGDWWKFNKSELGWRLFLDLAALMFWQESPQLFGDVFGRQFPLTYGMAPLVGLFLDHCLSSAGFISGFSRVDMPIVAPVDEAQ